MKHISGQYEPIGSNTDTNQSKTSYHEKEKDVGEKAWVITADRFETNDYDSALIHIVKGFAPLIEGNQCLKGQCECACECACECKCECKDDCACECNCECAYG